LYNVVIVFCGFAGERELPRQVGQKKPAAEKITCAGIFALSLYLTFRFFADEHMLKKEKENVKEKTQMMLRFF